MALVKDYLEKTQIYIQEYGKNTVVLMQVGAFFEVYGLQNKNCGEITGSQIESFSKVCDLNIADKKICVGKESVIMAGFSHYMIDKYLKKLQESGFTVIVFTQDEQAKNTTRSLNGIYSPGTYFSLESNNHLTNNTTCIWIHVTNELKIKEKQMYIGIANIDIYTGKTTMFECKEQYMMNPTTFDELDRFLSIHQPSEIILLGNIPDKELDLIVHFANIQCKCLHKINISDTTSDSSNSKRATNCEKQNFQRTILETFYTIHDFDVFYQQFYQNPIATQAFCYLLDFIYQHNPNLVKNIEEPIFDNHSERLILANHSLKQLNIIDDGIYTGKYSSVEKMLNMCSTTMGKRKFSRNLLHPTTNCNYLREEYNMTDHILTNLYDTLSQSIKTKLMSLKDISKIARQLVMKKISPKLLYQFHKNLVTVREIYSTLTNDDACISYIKRRIGTEICESIPTYCKEIKSFLEDRLQLSVCENIEVIQNFEINFIKHGVDTELDNKKQLYLEACNKIEAIREYLSKLITSYEKKGKSGATDHVKLHETEKNCFSLLATKRRCNNLKEIIQHNFTKDEKEQGIILHYTSNEEGTEKKMFRIKFFENIFFNNQSTSNDSILNSDITELCKLISSIKIQMKDLITGAFNKVVTDMERFQTTIQHVIEYITTVDVIFTKAAIARTYHYCKPEIVESSKSFVDVKDLRHCLIEHLQQNELYVTNDIHLGYEKVDGVLLYGTNAVGKTSFIRALGIAVVMAQAGLYVPCSAFHFFPYQTIFTRILGNDNMFKNLSSFAVEMYELRTILRLANEYSMVLGDELCSGTESISATSIFVAGIQQLHARKSSFIFATHLHEIIHYEELTVLETVELKHMAVVYDREKDLLLYDRKIKSGPGNNMYGLEVCKSLHLPDDFIEAAHQIRMKYHPTSDSLLSLKTSHFNVKKIVGLCEMCGKEPGKDVHHLQHQKIADATGYIPSNKKTAPFHKNHPANLLSLCEHCHDLIHKEKKAMHKKVKTSKGTSIINITI